MGQYHNTMFYDLRTALQADTSFERIICFFYRQFQRMKSVLFGIFHCQADVEGYTTIDNIIGIDYFDSIRR